jgi:hypothetical protein
VEDGENGPMTEQLQKGFSQEEAIILHFQGITISYEHF